ncbi:hypothetical protein RhiirA4_492424, partial [Rhizophagus irregularis]
MDTVSILFQKADNRSLEPTELAGNLIKWDIHVGDGIIKLEVFKKGKLISERTENYHFPYKYINDFHDDHELIASSLFNNNDIVILLATFGILIYTFSENNKSSEKDKSIFLNYFYFMKFDEYLCSYERKKYMKILQHYKRMFSKSTLPSPNYDSFRLDGWVSD